MAKKAKAGKLPKHIGGVKLPKEVRKGAAKLVKAAASPAGRELIATGLAMAAGAIRAQAGRQRAVAEAESAAQRPAPPVPPTPPSPPRAAPKAAPIAANAPDPHEIGVELGRIAEAALAGLFGRKK